MSMSISRGRAPPPSISTKTQNVSILNRTKKYKPQGHHLSVDKNIIDELLLVCGVIGSTEDPTSQKIVPVEDCLNWLQDLQRALRRDEDAYRPISLLLGQWKVVQQKLLPLVLSCRYDTPLVTTIVKILVILTKPLSETARNAGRLIIDTKSKKVEDAVIEEQIRLRDNAIAQANLLTEYKKLFVYHPSHRKKTSKKHSKQDNGLESKGLLSVFVSLLAEPLSKTGMARSNEDHLTVELILHLFRNLLCAGEPLFKDAENLQASTKLHQELIALFEKELVLDILLVIGQEMESRENVQYNLLIMEILHHLLKSQDPTLVAQSVLRSPTNTPPKNSAKSLGSSRFQGSQSSTPMTGSLRQKLQKERQHLLSANSSRHSHFGGTLVVQKSGGEQRYLAATASNKSFENRGANTSQVDAKRKTKKRQHFIGSGKPTSAYYSRPDAVHSSTSYTGPASYRAQRALHSFCSKFLSQCYGPVMKSLKDEFRRDSSRLEEEDKVTFFRIIWFFCQWRRMSVEERKNRSKEKSDESKSDSSKNVGRLVFTMDVYTFNLVLTSLDFYLEHKKYKHLAQAVSLYTEMIRLLHFMYTSSDSTEQIMAMGLMDHLFYKQDPLDRLPKLLSRWTPGTFTIEYLCDLLELTHTTLKTLDANEKTCADFGGKEKKGKGGKQEVEEPQDRVTRMKEKAAEFDTTIYFAKKLISNQVVFVFTQLLSQYSSNAPRINNHVIAFFVRLCKFVVARDDDYNFLSDNEANNEEKIKPVTLEPMLFNIHTLSVMNEILNDQSLRHDRDFRSLLGFAATFVRHYARTCEQNPMLYVETLFRHPMPHRYCEKLANNYVSEELKMIAERDILLGQQSSIYDDGSIAEAGDASSDEEELEFMDENKPDKAPKSKSNDNSKKEIDNVSSDEEQEMEFEDEIERVEKTMIDENKGVEDDDERWNSRRTFVPKRKLVNDKNEEEDNENSPEKVKEHELDSDDESKVDKNDTVPKRKFDLSSKDEEEESVGKSQSSPLSGTKKKRIKRTVFDDSSDEEEFGDTQITTSSSQKGSTAIFDDSDDDE